MPNRLYRDANGVLQPKITVGGLTDSTITSAELVDGTIVLADIADGAITNAKINASAGIAKTKLASLDIVNADVNASAGIDASKLTGVTTPASTDVFTNKTFDANGTGNALSNVENADLANSTIQAGKISFFKSTIQTANGSEQNVAHGLGRTPALVIVIPTELTGIGTITEGTHDGTNVKVTAVSGDKYIVVAL